MSNVTDVDVFKAALDHARQLSALRFAILTVFMTAMGALGAAYFSTLVHYPSRAVAIAGTWLSVVFLGCEISLSFTMAKQHAVAMTMAGTAYKDHFRRRHPIALWAIRLLIPTVHVFAGLYWFRMLPCAR